ncbi:conserved hypothetical protein [Cellvibrio japonicus Ueda107]|uniref:DUF1853 domain-containing protein n=2 Tax=Cellvibrio japonicus TaxID=155077 RepID=B3PJ65_CELJU|nr:conserved hypothetical protein [Cellvibrio japonicus Ueda107]QEI12627.1 DUF1853 family protein [Cellvibrio japonicus]QEI16201.1 DUF1853 family protein [Cellvibrio japonicus]QEI19779.1 DUF1853 family protein [Cellvibrio japonicus]
MGHTGTSSWQAPCPLMPKANHGNKAILSVGHDDEKSPMDQYLAIIARQPWLARVNFSQGTPMVLPVYDTPWLKQQLRSLRHQAVRDLAWCCLGQPLLQTLPDSPHTQLLSGLAPVSRLQTWLQVLDADPTPLLNHLALFKSTRLGVYYEALWHFYFTQQGDWELLGYNQQVNYRGQTLGAFDFLCRRQNTYWHIESAIKFYLGNSSGGDLSEWQHWIGPNNSDRLDIKLNHLQQHQLRLSANDEKNPARHWLQQHFTEAPFWHSGLLLQGYFFYPYQEAHTGQAAGAHPDHQGGYWMRWQDCEGFLSQSPAKRWVVIERTHWVSPAQGDELDSLMTSGQLAIWLSDWTQASHKPIMIAEVELFTHQAPLPVWQEQERYFVVPDNWPATHNT